jgi:hypothetical protein
MEIGGTHPYIFSLHTHRPRSHTRKISINPLHYSYSMLMGTFIVISNMHTKYLFKASKNPFQNYYSPFSVWKKKPFNVIQPHAHIISYSNFLNPCNRISKRKSKLTLYIVLLFHKGKRTMHLRLGAYKSPTVTKALSLRLDEKKR